MQKDKFTDFDLQIRSMLQDAEEEVSPRVWDAVSSRLDRRRVAGIWWRRAAVGMAAAAAVMAGVFFAASPREGVVDTTPLVAEASVPAAVEAPVVETVEEVPTIEEQIERSSALLADIPTRSSHNVAAVEASVENDADEPVEVEIVPQAVPSTPEETVEKAPQQVQKQKSEETWVDPFALMEYEDSHKKSSRGVSYFIEGNVTSNDRGEASTIRRSQSGVTSTPAQTGIAEKSISTYGIPLSFGIGARFPFGSRISFGTGINYTLLSRTFTGTYTQVSDRVVEKTVTADIHNNLHYIGIPFNLYYDVLKSNTVNFYVYAGGEVEKGLVNHFVIQSQPAITYRESVTGVQWSSALGMGVEFSLGQHVGLYFDPSARYYFDCNQPASVRTQKPYMLNFEVGLRLNL